MRSTWEGILAPIFDRSWWILGAKLGGKSTQNRSNNASKKRWKKEGQHDGQKIVPGAATDSEAVRRRCGVGGARSSFLAAPRAAALREKIPVKNNPETTRSDTPWASGPANYWSYSYSYLLFLFLFLILFFLFFWTLFFWIPFFGIPFFWITFFWIPSSACRSLTVKVKLNLTFELELKVKA